MTIHDSVEIDCNRAALIIQDMQNNVMNVSTVTTCDAVVKAIGD